MTKQRIFLSPIGKHLRKLRIDQDMDQKQMSAALGLPATILTRIERGRANPSPELAAKIIEVFGNPSEVWRLIGMSQTRVEFNMIGLSESQRLQVLNLHRTLYGGDPIEEGIIVSPEDPTTPIQISVLSPEEEKEMAAIDGMDDIIDMEDGVGFLDVDDEVPSSSATGYL